MEEVGGMVSPCILTGLGGPSSSMSQYLTGKRRITL